MREPSFNNKTKHTKVQFLASLGTQISVARAQKVCMAKAIQLLFLLNEKCNVILKDEKQPAVWENKRTDSPGKSEVLDFSDFLGQWNLQCENTSQTNVVASFPKIKIVGQKFHVRNYAGWFQNNQIWFWKEVKNAHFWGCSPIKKVAGNRL